MGATGLVLAGFELWHFFQMTSPLGRVIEAAIPFVMALLIVYASYWLTGSEFEAADKRRITAWFAIGLVGMALVAGWIISHQFFRGVGFHHWYFVVAGSMTAGGMGGFLVGVYDSRRRQHHRSAESVREAIAAVTEGVAILDENGVYQSVNQSHAEVYGYDSPETFVGETWHMCYTDAERARVEADVMPELQAVGSWRGELTGRRADGTTFPQEITLTQLSDGGLVCVVRNVSARKTREQQLASREKRLRTLVENMPVVMFTVDRNREITLQVGKGLEEVGVQQNEMVGASIDDVFADTPEVVEAVDRSLDGESIDVTLGLWDRTYQVWYEPVEDAGEVTSVIGVAMDITEQHRREEGIRALHDATRDMMRDTDHEAICRIAVETAQHALDMPLSGIWLRDDDGSRLEPAAWSDQAAAHFDDPPTYEPGNSLSWTVFEENETRVFDDVSTHSDRFNDETRIRSDLIVPIAGYGVLNSGSTEPDRFDRTDVLLAQLLAANTRAALERAEREAALQRQTDQMEFFNAILRHDVLNGLTIIRARAEFLTEELTGEQRRDAEIIIDWSNDIAAIVTRVRSVLDTLTGRGTPQLGAADLSGILQDELDRVRDTYPDVRFEQSIPDGVTVCANDLLGEVFGNLITNAVDHNSTDELRVSVTVEPGRTDDDPVTVRIADNGDGIPDDRKDAIFSRGESGDAKPTGSGFGLFFVDAMVTEYGGDVWIEDNEPSGAVFHVELPTATT